MDFKNKKMKYYIIGFLIALGLLSLALCDKADAAPFLICDGQTGVDYYMVDMDGTIFDLLRAEVQADGSIKYDLMMIGAGPHVVKLQACSDLWGCEGWSAEFPFDKTIPGLPSGIRIVAQ